MNVVFAHAGHWLASVAYAAPVVVLAGWLGVVRLRDNRARANKSDHAALRVAGEHRDASDGHT